MRTTYLDVLAQYGIDGAHPGGLPLTMRILNSLVINYNTRLIDLGCGTGQTLTYIYKTYRCKPTGVDINRQMLQKAVQRFRNENLPITLYHADVMQLPFSSGTFDIALSESVTVFTDINKALKEYARVLKKGGTLLAIEMTAMQHLNPKEMREIKSVYGIGQVPTAYEWERMFIQAGFRDVRTYDVQISPTLKLNSWKMFQDFAPHLYMIQRYSRKLGYKVYKCIP